MVNEARTRARARGVTAAIAAALAVGCTQGAGRADRLAGQMAEGAGDRGSHLPVALSSSAASGEGGVHLIAATTGRPALEAGLAVMVEGGGAVDAVLTAALDQIVLSAGAWNSLAGTGALLYHEASSGRTIGLDGSYRSFAEELAPATIPAGGVPSGRTALVPGLPALIHAAHERFGRVRFERLFEPAIGHAEHGLIVSDLLAGLFAARAPVLTRLEATAAVYAPSGQLPVLGSVFRQPALADTLRHFAREGARYLYQGAWAERFVAAVRAEGGRATLGDLSGYGAQWSEARCVPFAGDEICSLGGRNVGGGALLEALLLAEVAGLPALGGWQQSVEALEWTVRASRVALLLAYTPELLPDERDFLVDRLPGVSRELDARLEPRQAERLLEHVASGAWEAATTELMAALAKTAAPSPRAHSDAIVAIDGAGNAACLVHTINTESWGATGLNVDGVSIPDSAAFQQGALVLAGPGGHLRSMLNPAMRFERGALRLAASAIGNVHYAMFGMLAGSSGAESGSIALVTRPIVSGSPYAEMVPAGSAPAGLLAAAAARGLELREGDDPVPPFRVAAAPGEEPRARLSGAVSPVLAAFGGGALGVEGEEAAE